MRKYWLDNSIGDQSSYSNFADFWNWTVHNGFTNSTNQSVTPALVYNDYPIQINSQENILDWEFIVYQKELGVGHHAANPWLQELRCYI